MFGLKSSIVTPSTFKSLNNEILLNGLYVKFTRYISSVTPSCAVTAISVVPGKEPAGVITTIALSCVASATTVGTTVTEGSNSIS